MAFTAAQRAAIAHTKTHVPARKEKAQRLVRHVFRMSNVPSEDLAEAMGGF